MKKYRDLHERNFLEFFSIKTIRVMKITLFLSMLTVFQLWATDTYSQLTKLTFKLENSTIADALKEIENQSEFFFLYSPRLIDVERKINIEAKNEPIRDVLNDIFKEDVAFKVFDRQIILTPKELVGPIIEIQQRRVTGTVTDKNGAPLPGTNVFVTGTAQGTTTDMAGKYSIEVPDGARSLTFSYVGMEPQTVVIGALTLIDVIMAESAFGLDEVVVVGYGTQKAVNLTGSVTAISAKEIVKRTSHNVGNLLQGKVAGLQVTQNTGQPGVDNAVMTIRGMGTFSTAGNQPYVLIDGIQGNLSTLNPQNIESISVLKDAASASIYGAKAANGVILVTTKQGNPGKMIIEYSGNYQIHQPTRLPKLVTNSADFMTYLNRVYERGNKVKPYSQEEIDLFRNAAPGDVRYPNFDWLKHMIRNGNEQQHYLSFSGGNEKTTFNVAIGHLNQNGIVINDAFRYSRTDLMANYKQKINKFITFGSKFSLVYGNSKEPVCPRGDFFPVTMLTNSPMYMPKLSDGSGRWALNWKPGKDGHNRQPEWTIAIGDARTETYTFDQQMFLDINITKDLVFSVKGAVVYESSFYKRFEKNNIPCYYYFDNTLANPHFGWTPGVINTYGISVTPTVFSTFNYTKSFKNHNLKALLGYSQESNFYRYMTGTRTVFSTNLLSELEAGSASNQSLSGSATEWALQSFFGRINYDYKGKYLMEGNLRYDGSSRLNSDTRWGMFPSFSAGWRLSEESFMKQFKWIDNLKLRASWGQLGNQNIGFYPYQDIMSYSYYPFGSTLSQGASVTRLTDKELKWETTTITDVGIDLSTKNRLFSLTADWFNKVTDGILYVIEVPSSIGLTAPLTNFGKMKNTGFEFEVGHANKIHDFMYSVNFNLTAYKNEVLKVAATTITSREIIKEGLPFRSHYLYEWIGIFQSQEEIDNSPKQPYNPKPGDLKYKDQNNDGKITPEDYTVIDGAFPKFFYGSNINLSWKNFDLSAFMQGTQGQKFYSRSFNLDAFDQGCPPTLDYAKNAWTPQNPSNKYAAMSDGDNMAVYGLRSTYHLLDGSYFRLKNVTLGYNLPTKICNRIGVNSMRIYLSGDNLITITESKYIDPERTYDLDPNRISGSNARNLLYPQLKTFLIGLNVKF